MKTTTVKDHLVSATSLSDFSLVPYSPPQVWLFQATEDFDLLSEIHNPLGMETWTLKTNYRRIHQGDVAVFWQAGQRPGVYSSGEICSEPYLKKSNWKVDIRYLYSLPSPISAATLADDLVLRELKNFRFRNAGHAYSVTLEQWRALFDQVKKLHNGGAESDSKWWWVNQGGSWLRESRSGSIYAEPAEGRRVKHRDNIKLVAPGDFIIHHVKGEVRAVGTALGAAVPSRTGHRVAVQYENLDSPISLSQIPLKLRLAESKAFDKNGEVNQGYLYPLSNDFIEKLYDVVGDKLPLRGRSSRLGLNQGWAEDRICAEVWAELAESARTLLKISSSELCSRVPAASGLLAKLLSRIQRHCDEVGLPPLVLVITDLFEVLMGSDSLPLQFDDLEYGLTKVFSYAGWEEENPFLDEGDDLTDDDIVSALIDDPSRSSEIWSRVRVRGQKQVLFRRVLLAVYNQQCAFCGLSFVEALEAAHIVPWSQANSAQRCSSQNGLLLCSTHHRLFDAGIMTIDSSYRIVFSASKERVPAEADATVGEALHGLRARLPAQAKHHPSKEFLRERSKMFQARST